MAPPPPRHLASEPEPARHRPCQDRARRRPVGKPFIRFGLGRNGFTIDRIRPDRILREALTAGADPLHLSLVFNISHATATRYASVAEHLLSDELEQPQEQ